MRHKRAVLLTAAILSLPVVLLSTSMLLLQTRWFSQIVSDRLSGQWERRVLWSHPLTIDWSLSPAFTVDNLQLADAAWTDREQMLTAEQVTVRIALWRLLHGVLDFEQVQLTKPELHLESSGRHGKNWDPILPDETPDVPVIEVRVGEIFLLDGKMTYTSPSEKTRIRIEVDNQSGQTLQIKTEGNFRGEHFIADLAGGPVKDEDEISGKTNNHGTYGFRGEARWQDHRLGVEGRTQSLSRLSAIKLDTDIKGPDIGQILAQPGLNGEPVPYQVNARVEHSQKGNTTSKFRGMTGKSEFSGSLGFENKGKKPRWLADLQIDDLDVSSIKKLIPLNNAEGQKVSGSVEEKIWHDHLISHSSKLQTFDADLQIAIGKLQKDGVVVQNLHSESRVRDAKLEQRLSMEFGGGRFLWTVELDTTRAKVPAGHAELVIDNVNLGEALASRGLATLGIIDGEVKLEVRNSRLTVQKSQVHYRQPDQNSDLVVRLANYESKNNPDGIRVKAAGKIEGEDFNLDLTAGPLLSLTLPEDSYPVDGQFEYLDNSASIKGTLQQPLLLAGMDMDLTAVGNSPEDLAPFSLGYLHKLQPFKVSARLVNQDAFWTIRNLKAEVGDSDLSGSILVTRRPHQRPFVEVDLVSEKLVIAQLLPPPAETRPDAPAQEKQGESGVLPENDLFHQSVKSADVRVEFAAEEIDVAGISTQEVTIKGRVDAGQLALDPVSVALGSGTVHMSVNVDANENPSVGTAKIEVLRVGLGDVLEPLDVTSDTNGLIGGEGTFWFSGASLAEVLASLDGKMELVMTDGQLDASLVAAAGLNLSELLDLLFDDEEAVDIRCAYTRLAAENGQLAIDPMLIITGERNIIGDGYVNFEKEQFKFEIEAKAKDFSLLSAANPVRIEGTFSDHELDILSDELVARGMLAAAGGAIFPPAALLGLVETGDAKAESGCHKAVQSADTARDRAAPE